MMEQNTISTDTSGLPTGQSLQSGDGSPIDDSEFLRELGITRKKPKADGNVQKRRGPKPDSKPALNRRQELNRQAQRTHRQRKEQYTLSLEHQVASFREATIKMRNERDEARREIVLLREFLAQHGLVAPPPSSLASQPSSEPGLTYGSATLNSAGSSLQSPSPPTIPTANEQTQPPGRFSPNQVLDYAAIGSDFILTLEGPCRDHLSMLAHKAYHDDKEFSGHALMASCPPQEQLMQYPYILQYHSPRRPPSLDSASLEALLKASEAIAFEQYGVKAEEITPIKAWSLLTQNPGFNAMTPKHFQMLKDLLLPLIRCFGFGAVVEESDMLDAMNNVLSLANEEMGASESSIPTQVPQAVQ